MNDMVRITPRDMVAVALKPLRAGETVSFGTGVITLKEDLPMGHKAALREIPGREPLTGTPPALPVPERVTGIREAMLSPRETVPVEKAVGRVLADACVSCPPAVPVVIAGERVTADAAACMAYTAPCKTPASTTVVTEALPFSLLLFKALSQNRP